MDILRETIEWFFQFVFFAILFLGVLWFSGCTTPEKWRPVDHHSSMKQCRVMCAKQVRSYEPLTGECSCYQRKGD